MVINKVIHCPSALPKSPVSLAHSKSRPPTLKGMSRSIIIDDNDVALISYIGPWSSVYDPVSSIIPGHPYYSNTAHHINKKGSLNFTFQGSEINVFGTPSPNAQWNCSLDESDMHDRTTMESQDQYQKLCNFTLVADTFHTLFISVAPDVNPPFYLDFIQYTPSPGASFDNATVYISPSDAAIEYAGNWSNVTVPDAMTAHPQSNASLVLMFQGISVAWLTPQENIVRKSVPSIATYSIDDQNPVQIDLSPTSVNYTEILFESPQLAYGQHNLTVTYQGVNYPPYTPITLSLAGFIVRNATRIPSSSTTIVYTSFQSTLTNPSSATSARSSNAASGHKLTPIAGGVIGGLVIFVALLLLLTAFLLYRRRRRNRELKEMMASLRAFGSLTPVNKSERLPSEVKSTDSLYANRPPYPTPSDLASSSSSLSYTSQADFSKPRPVSSGYWEILSTLGRRSTRGTSMGTIADNGLLKRPDDVVSPTGSGYEAKGIRTGLPANPAVYREAHRNALQQLLGIGSQRPQAAVPPVPKIPVPKRPSGEESARHHDAGPPLRPSGHVTFEDIKVDLLG